MTTFGMEFEIQGLNPDRAARALFNAGIQCERPNSTHATAENWKAVYDGSVSNGAEVVSPILSEARLNEAHKVTKALKDSGARVDRATGFHVHIGADAFGGKANLASFILNYYGAHHAIAALVAPSRLNNRYCAILNRTAAEAQASHTLNGNEGAYNGNRYTSLNIEAMQRHGTIEVRLHQGTLNGVKAIAWAKLMSAMVDATKNGLDIHEIEGLTPWQQYATPSVEQCGVLLDTLTTMGSLNAATGDWLKGRAARLNG